MTPGFDFLEEALRLTFGESYLPDDDPEELDPSFTVPKGSIAFRGGEEGTLYITPVDKGGFVQLIWVVENSELFEIRVKHSSLEAGVSRLRKRR